MIALLETETPINKRQLAAILRSLAERVEQIDGALHTLTVLEPNAQSDGKRVEIGHFAVGEDATRRIAKL